MFSMATIVGIGIPELKAEAKGTEHLVGQESAQLEESEFGRRLSMTQKDTRDEKTISREYQLEVEKLGAELFPQYAEKEVTMRTRTVSTEELGTMVYSETKPVSETEDLTYVEYSSGRAALFYQKSWTDTSTSPAVSGGTQYRRTLVVTVNGCYGSVYVSGFIYTINLNNYDWIDNEGVCRDNSGITLADIDKAMEDGSPAVASYAGNVEDMLFSYTVSISFEIRVGGNTARVYAQGQEV